MQIEDDELNHNFAEIKTVNGRTVFYLNMGSLSVDQIEESVKTLRYLIGKMQEDEKKSQFADDSHVVAFQKAELSEEKPMLAAYKELQSRVIDAESPHVDDWTLRCLQSELQYFVNFVIEKRFKLLRDALSTERTKLENAQKS